MVAILKSGCSKDERVMHLMRCLFFVLAHYNMSIIGQHIPGVENRAADALSRNDAHLFLSQVPSANREPAVIPRELLHIVLFSQYEWTAENWTTLWKYILRRV